MKQHPVHKTVELIQKKSNNFLPKLGIILGSGLGEFASRLENPTVIPYQELSGFPSCGVAGHPGNLFLGTWHKYPLVCLQGRAHPYEGISKEPILTMIWTLKLLGCETLLITNAAGSLRSEIIPGQLMLITDHINMQSFNPLVGNDDEMFGSRFVSMENAYDPKLRERLLLLADELRIPLAQGVYMGVMGPSFETPAEIRAFRILGADAIGMSTVSEVIVARQCGLKTAAISVITNMAAGMSRIPLSHEQTLAYAKSSSETLTKLLLNFIKSLSHD